jgi:hypothetical protein
VLQNPQKQMPYGTFVPDAHRLGYSPRRFIPMICKICYGSLVRRRSESE